jgi:hypothetical protein
MTKRGVGYFDLLPAFCFLMLLKFDLEFSLANQNPPTIVGGFWFIRFRLGLLGSRTAALRRSSGTRRLPHSR